VYCPNCGSSNQAEIKFCTRCGTNLNAVTEALSGKFMSQAKIDERTVKALKDYYSSRRAALVGALTLPVGLAMLMAMSVNGFPEHLVVIALMGLGLLIYGAAVGIWGIAHWIDSTSEMKALKTAASQALLAASSRDQINAAPAAEIAQRYSTDPIQPESVTENTTRQLEESRPHRENQPKQIQ